MAVPRQKKSRSRRQNQRSHDALKKANTNLCPKCGDQKMPHRICATCGWYRDRTVIELDAE